MILQSKSTFPFLLLLLNPSYSPATKLMTQVLDSAFVEHDAYILFGKLMTFGKSWYEFNDDVPSRKIQSKIKVNLRHTIFFFILIPSIVQYFA